jgi:hypothetical protein
LKKGDFRAEAGYLGLEQKLAADAAVDLSFLAGLRPILQRLDNRGYRVFQLEAGIVGGKLYLGAYAQRLGATGLTFYEEAATQIPVLTSPDAAVAKLRILLGMDGGKARHVAVRNPA